MGIALPFTRDAFLDVFASYNEAVWPAHVVAYGLAAICLLALVREEQRFQRPAAMALAAMWLWTGIVYHGIYFAPINGAARLFAAFFVIEGVWLLAVACGRGGLGFHRRGGIRGVAGAALIVYATILYPVAGALAGDVWPRVPAFGITPCPLTLFTLGLLLFTRRAGGLWVAPLFWSAASGSATLRLGMVQDSMLLVAGPLIAFLLILDAWRRHRHVASGKPDPRAATADGQRL